MAFIKFSPILFLERHQQPIDLHRGLVFAGAVPVDPHQEDIDQDKNDSEGRPLYLSFILY
jgi:hypothetical protein